MYMSVISHTNCVHTAWVQKHPVCTSVLMNGQQGDWFSSIWSWSEEVSPLSQDQAPFQSQPYPQPHQIYTCAQTCSTKCPMTDWKQTTNSTIDRLANRLFQNNWIFSISILVPKPLFILYRFFFFFKGIQNLLHIRYPIVCKKGLDLLVPIRNAMCYRNREKLLRFPTKNDRCLI